MPFSDVFSCTFRCPAEADSESVFDLGYDAGADSSWMITLGVPVRCTTFSHAFPAV